MSDTPVLLAIESSCDDTAVAVLRGYEVLASVVSSQVVHEIYGGVVPELASRAHQRFIVPVYERALREAGIGRDDLDAVAVTYGPGLSGSLLVGLSFGKALALGLGVPLIGVNHLEGHVYSVYLGGEGPPRPYLALVVSGGHTQLVWVQDNLSHETLGRTRDDAAGEAYDKVAQMLELGYPGGPPVDRLAQQGDAAFHEFPRPRPGGLDLSFSGVKTAVLHFLHRQTRRLSDDERTAWLERHTPDVCAAFQQAVVDQLEDRLHRAVRQTGAQHVALVGGVSANTGLHAAVETLAEKEHFLLHVPPLRYCTDNAAMIGVTAQLMLEAGVTTPLSLTAEPALAL